MSDKDKAVESTNVQGEQKQNNNGVQAVFSFKIAESLCADYPYFRSLIAVEKNNKDPSKRVWFFRRSEEFDKDFEELKEEAIKAREIRQKQLDEGKETNPIAD